MLVLLPTSSSKQLAQWQGPYTIERKVEKVNYEVDMSDRRKRKYIFSPKYAQTVAHTYTH